jgi:hypothetical protein
MGSSLIQLTLEKRYDSGNVDHYSCITRLKVIVYFMELWLETVDHNSGRLGQVIT